MADHLVLNDPFARLVWRLYLLRARSVLAAAPAATRTELIGDLKNHLWEIMTPTEDRSEERKRLKSALARIGDPQDFLSPLLAAGDTAPAWNARLSQIMFRLTRVSVFVISVLAMGFVLIVGLAGFGASIASLFANEKNAKPLRIE